MRSIDHYTAFVDTSAIDASDRAMHAVATILKALNDAGGNLPCESCGKPTEGLVCLCPQLDDPDLIAISVAFCRACVENDAS